LIGERIRRTPVLFSPRGELGVPSPVSLKLELMQHAGSFKTRGAFTTLLTEKVPAVGVAAASGGNHGVAVAYAAKTLGIHARIFVPEISSPAKVAAIKAHGADVRIFGQRYADAQEACDAYVLESGALRIHPFDADLTIRGQATLGLEWDEQTRDPHAFELDTVLVACGGGGLVCGIASYYKGTGTKVYAVEPRGSCALSAALAAGGPVDVAVESVAADSLGARNVGARVYSIAKEMVTGVVLVDDDAIVAAQARLLSDLRLAIEPGGAAAAAALLSGAYVPAKDERVGVLLCGGNVDLAKLVV
jgi:threonine dehydratase